MFKQFIISDFNSVDLKIEFCGYHKCEKSHSYGPAVRDSYLVHFCINGKGIFCDKNGRHYVSKGEFFIIRPNEMTTYTADTNEPWEYLWIAFSGKDANIFNNEISVYPFEKEIGVQLYSLINNEINNANAFKSIIYKIIYNTYTEQISSLDVVSKIKQYILFNYMEDLSIKKLSSLFGFERTYLYRLFKKKVGVSIKDYVIKTRMNKAKLFLKKGYNVNSTATLVGYNDSFNFSKAFKKHYGISPNKITKNLAK